jgi:hypothetical protein
VEKVKRKKKGERNVEDLRAEGVRGCTCEEFFFFFEIELMSDVWQREKKKKSLELNIAVGSCWCWWVAAGGLGKKI